MRPPACQALPSPGSLGSTGASSLRGERTVGFDRLGSERGVRVGRDGRLERPLSRLARGEETVGRGEGARRTVATGTGVAAVAAGAPLGRAADRVLTTAGAGSGLEASRLESVGFARPSELAGRDSGRSAGTRSGTGAA